MVSFYTGVCQIYTACRRFHLSYPFISVCIFRETSIIHAILWCSESCDCTKDQHDQWNALWLWNPMNHWWENMAPSLPQSLCRGLCSLCCLLQILSRGLSSSRSLPQSCAEVSEAPIFDYSNCQSRSILNSPLSLQVLPEVCENAPAESETTLQSSRVGWGHLGVLRSSGEGYQSAWEVWVWIPDRITFSWCGTIIAASGGGWSASMLYARAV